jgi:hypothetical protein
MKVLRITIACLLIFIVSYGVSHAQETILFAAGADNCIESDLSTLYRIDPANGNSIEVGPIGFQNVTGLAFLGDGRLVGSANADVGDTSDRLRVAILIEISPFTGQASEIGEIGDNETPGECGRAPDLTYDPDTDTLFAIGKRCEGVGIDDNFLMRINQTTGQGTQIGNTGELGSGNGLAIRDDSVIFWTESEPALYTLNPLTGVATPVTALSGNFSRLGAMAFHPVTQVLFATNLNPGAPFVGDDDAVLQTVNITTGLLTDIGQLPDCTDALIFGTLPPSSVPTLSEWGLIMMASILGIVGFMAIRKRKVTA